MTKNLKGFLMPVLSLALVAGCAATEPADPGPPPPQNLIGATDELQLVTELSINLAETYGLDQVLVVLGLDNTLLALDEDPCTSGEVKNEADSGGVYPTQADAAEQVRRMQDAGLNVIVMTTRGPECRQQILQALNSNRFSFQVSAWPPRDGYPETFLPKGGVRPVIYEDGVFFVAEQNMGVMLNDLLEKAGGPYPRVIVMADQGQENLNAVMKTFSWTTTKVHAWRYTREDT